MKAVKEKARKDGQDDKGAFSPTAVIGLLLAGVFSFAALMVLLAYAPDLRTGGDSGAHALSKSGVGFGGTVKLLRETGTPVLVSRTRKPAAGSLFVLTPDPSDKIADIKALTAGRVSLVVLPKWETSRDFRNPEWVTRFAPIAATTLERGIVDRLTGGRLIRRKGPFSIAPAEPGGVAAEGVTITDEQTLSGSKWRPVLVDQAGAVLMVRSPDQPLFLLVEPDLLNTYGLRNLKGARTAMAVLEQARSGSGAVVFDVTLNGYERSRSMWKLAFEPPFLAATLCAIAAAIMMGLHAGVRFGAPAEEDRAFGLGKRALADNQAALIRLAKREHRMAEAYASLVRDRVARAVGAGHTANAAELEQTLDRLGGSRTQLSISALMQEARKVTDPAGLMRLARRLHQWKLEITRERQ